MSEQSGENNKLAGESQKSTTGNCPARRCPYLASHFQSHGCGSNPGHGSCGGSKLPHDKECHSATKKCDHSCGCSQGARCTCGKECHCHSCNCGPACQGEKSSDMSQGGNGKGCQCGNCSCGDCGCSKGQTCQCGTSCQCGKK